MLIIPKNSPESSSCCKFATPRTAHVESLGRSFYKRQYNISDEKQENEDEENSEMNLKREELREKLDDKNLNLEDYYALMGLKEISWKASVEQIKENWKIISFICHPDKSTPEHRERNEKRFKAMQLAFKTLTSPKERIGYDSALPFDEGVPKDHEGVNEDTFYKVYGPVFDRNSRFSARKPVPELGTKSTPYESVLNFYDFWFDFKSWREFTHLDEHKNDDGTDRYTRRENDRKNMKLRAGAKKKETARVRKLVEDANKKDPRILAHKKKIKDEIEAKKKAKRDAKQKIIDDARNKILEEARAKEAALLAEKNAQDTKKKAASGYKKNLKKIPKLCKSGRAGEYDPEEVKAVVGVATMEEAQELVVLMSMHSGPSPPPLTDAEKQQCRDAFNSILIKTPLGKEKLGETISG